LMGDKKHGACEYFYNNGSKKSREIYRNDTLQSDTIWYSSGKISAESHYKNGLKTGVYREYYPTGTVRVEQMYVNGVEEGMYKSYFASGQIYNEGQFKDGKLSGELKFYSEKGKLTHTKQYN
jgi:antitoxin component YwqK of YwqJK toxin-antitoxin module